LNDLIELYRFWSLLYIYDWSERFWGIFRFEESPNCDVTVQETRSNYVIYVFLFQEKRKEFYLEQMHKHVIEGLVHCIYDSKGRDTEQSACLSGLRGGNYSSISIRRQSLGNTLAVDRHHHSQGNVEKQEKKQMGNAGRGSVEIFGFMQIVSRLCLDPQNHVSLSIPCQTDYL